MYSIFTVYVQYITVYLQYMYSICTVYVQYMYSIFTVYVQYIYSKCTVYLQYIYSIHVQCVTYSMLSSAMLILLMMCVI